MSTDDLTPDDPEPHETPAAASDADPDRLARIASAFGDQAAYLRRRAYWNIRSIVATVILMTVLVIALPPLVNVAEDRLLAYFGYQTSQIDFQRETARQAADVRARSQRLLDMLDERDDLIREVNDELSTNDLFFVPEMIPTPEWSGQPQVVAVAENDDLQVAVGRLSRSLSGPPMIAMRDAESGWKLLGRSNRNIRGGVYDVTAYGDGFLAGGDLGSEAILWKINTDGGLSRAFEIAGPLQKIELLTAEPESGMVAVGGSTGRTGHLRVYSESGKLLWRSRVVLGERKGLIDMLWHDQTLYALLATSLATTVLTVDFATSDPIVRRDVLGNAQEVPIAFTTPERNGDVSAVLIDFRSKYKEIKRNENGEWIADGILNGAPIPVEGINARTTARSVFHLDGKQSVFGASGGSRLTLFNYDRTGASSETIPMASRAFQADFFRVFAFGNGRLRLSPEMRGEQRGRSEQPLFYVQSPAPRIETPERDPEIAALLEGRAVGPAVGDAPLPGDTTAESAGIADGPAYYARSTQPTLDALHGPLMEGETLANMFKLRETPEHWQREWNEREKSANILARLRQADQAGSLWRNISSLAARLAVIALLIYLVNILVNLYRYNMRLAAFYQARRDAIEMALASGADLTSMVQGSLADLATSNTPEEVTFGPRPALPTDALLKAIPDLAKIVKP